MLIWCEKNTAGYGWLTSELNRAPLPFVFIILYLQLPFLFRFYAKTSLDEWDFYFLFLSSSLSRR